MTKLRIQGVWSGWSEPFAASDSDDWILLDQTKSWQEKKLDITLEIEIGIQGSSGADVFSLRLIGSKLKKLTEEWTLRRCLIVVERDWEQVKREIKLRVLDCEAETERETLIQLRQRFLWEFEGNTVEGLN
jgi:Immunity protein 8